jgi:CubicO group peptidase (beta-lactamase class C family)
MKGIVEMRRVDPWELWCGVIVLAFMTLGNYSALAQTASHAAAEPMTQTVFAKFIRDYAESHHFNGSIRVEEDGKALFNGSFGIADRAFNVPCSDDTKYKIASITKAFTAVLILQLVEEKKIDLGQSIKTYLPKYSGEGASTVTIRMLLNHTSGLPNADAAYSSVPDALAHGMPHYQLPATPDQLIERYYSGKLINQPGKVFSYNNADYIVLGRIIESAVGSPFEQVLQDRILSRLDMHDTGLLHQRDIILRLAPSYFSPEKGAPLINDMPVYTENWYAAGGMYSTTADLTKFADALYGGKLLSAASLDLMLTPGLDGYGFGVWIGNPSFGGKTYRNINRPGGVMGANGSFYHFNGVGFSKSINIVILSNTDQTDMDAFSWDIGKVLLDSGATGNSLGP